MVSVLCSASKPVPLTAAHTEPDDDVETETVLAQRRLADMVLSGQQALPEELMQAQVQVR